jgi:hypothetical protein
MKYFFYSPWRLSLCISLWLVSFPGFALTFDKLSAAPVVGRALQVSVTAHLTAEEDPSSLCLEAEVYYGENRQSSAKVSTSLDTARVARSVLIKVESQNPVDEPIVTVYLKSGCVSKVTRRYVLLSEVLSDVTAGVALPAGAISERTDVLRVDSGQKNGATTAAASTSPRQALAAEKRSATRQSKAQDKSAVLANTTQNKANVQPRLKLVPLDLGTEINPELHSSPALLSTPSEDVQKRAEAAALWRSLNATPEEIMRANARLEALEKDVKTIVDSAALERKRIAELANKVEQAQARQYSNPLIWLLAALLIVLSSMAVLLYVKWKKIAAAQQQWWRSDSIPPVNVEPHAAQVPQPVSVADEVRINSSNPEAVRKDALTSVDLLLDEPLSVISHSATDPVVRGSAHKVVSKGDTKDFAQSGFGALRELNTEELLDVRQQAAFFMALGQHDQAIGILEGRIKESADANPLMYLDLLEFLHKLGRKKEFDSYRTQFNEIFTGQIPEFDSFSQGGLGLENYPQKLEKIIMLWPESSVVTYIEKCLVQQPDEGHTDTVELEAFRELLILHAIAARVTGKATGRPAPFSASLQTSAPESLKTTPVSATGTGSGIEVDFDLSESAQDLIQFDAGRLSNNAPLD